MIDHMGNDLTVVNAARVSFGKKSDIFSDKDKKLIKYLADHKHYSPFGHCFASFHVKAPIFVRSQLVKHEYLRMNEISRRYVDTSPEFYTPEVWRHRANDKKQGSGKPFLSYDDPLYDGETEKYISMEDLDGCLEDIHTHAKRQYKFLIDEGVAPEQARMVLPQSMYTEWYWSGSLDAFANMYNLRSKPDAQEETRLITKEIGGIMSGLYPHSWEALTNES